MVTTRSHVIKNRSGASRNYKYEVLSSTPRKHRTKAVTPVKVVLKCPDAPKKPRKPSSLTPTTPEKSETKSKKYDNDPIKRAFFQNDDSTTVESVTVQEDTDDDIKTEFDELEEAEALVELPPSSTLPPPEPTVSYSDHDIYCITNILKSPPYTGIKSETPETLRKAKARAAAIKVHLLFLEQKVINHKHLSFETKDLLKSLLFEIKKWVDPLPYNGATGTIACDMIDIANNRYFTLKRIVERFNRLFCQPVKPMYEVNIDFDEASRTWKSNKVKLTDGCYRYRKVPTKRRRHN